MSDDRTHDGDGREQHLRRPTSFLQNLGEEQTRSAAGELDESPSRIYNPTLSVHGLNTSPLALEGRRADNSWTTPRSEYNDAEASDTGTSTTAPRRETLGGSYSNGICICAQGSSTSPLALEGRRADDSWTTPRSEYDDAEASDTGTSTTAPRRETLGGSCSNGVCTPHLQHPAADAAGDPHTAPTRCTANTRTYPSHYDPAARRLRRRTRDDEAGIPDSYNSYNMNLQHPAAVAAGDPRTAPTRTRTYPS